MRLPFFKFVAIGCVAILLAVSPPGHATAQNTMKTAGSETGNWHKVPGKAVDIAINGAGQAYAIGLDGTPWHWDRAQQRWRKMSGKFARITAGKDNHPWAVDADGVVFRYNGLWWENKDAKVVDVAGNADGEIYIAKADGQIKKWNGLRNAWEAVRGSAWHLALDGAGNPWVVSRDGSIQAFDGKGWIPYPGRAHDIAVGGTDAVMIVDAAGLVRHWDGVKQRWGVVEGVDNAAALAVTPEGNVWVVTRDGEILSNGGLAPTETGKKKKDEATVPTASVPQAPGAAATSLSAPQSVAEAISAPPIKASTPGGEEGNVDTGHSATRSGAIDPVTVTTKDRITFVDTRAPVAKLAIGADGSVFGLDRGGNVLRWSNDIKAFKSFPGTLVRIAVDPDGNPWGVSALGRVFRHTGNQWKQIHGITAADISIAYDGTVLIADASKFLYAFDDKTSRFVRAMGAGAAVAAGPDGTPWTIRSDQLVQRCDAVPCTVLPQKAISLSVGPDGSVWIVSSTNQLMRLKKDGKSFEVVRTPGHTPTSVAVGPMGYPWVIDRDDIALASNFFERDESKDRLVAAATTGGTVGSGATDAVTTSSVSGFSFTKNMQFETVGTDIFSPSEYVLLDAGNDGTFYGFNSGNLGKYNTKTKKFEKLTSKLIKDGYYVNDFAVTSKGDVWAYTTNPTVSIVREYNNHNSLKVYTVSSLTASEAVAVAPDDTVYAVFASESSYWLYRKGPNDNSFSRFSSYDNIYDVGVGPGNDVWIVDKSNYVRHWDGSRFVKTPASGQLASKIDVGADGTVYIKDTGNALRKWNATNKSFDKVNGTSLAYVAVEDDGRPWMSVDNTPTVKRAKE